MTRFTVPLYITLFSAGSLLWSMDTEIRSHDISFSTTIVFTVGLQSELAGELHTVQHPFLVGGLAEGEKPYTKGNGGLLNPILKKYSVFIKTVDNKDCIEQRIQVMGVVAADGIAPYNLDRPYIGEPYPIEDNKSYYRMSRLEEAILGYLQERRVDVFDMIGNFGVILNPSKTPYADRFKACIENEWTSKRNDQDTGTRTPIETELIQRYMPFSVYQALREKGEGALRFGEWLRKYSLNGDNDKHASVKLTEFTVDVPVNYENNRDEGNALIIGTMQSCQQQ